MLIKDEIWAELVEARSLLDDLEFDLDALHKKYKIELEDLPESEDPRLLWETNYSDGKEKLIQQIRETKEIILELENIEMYNGGIKMRKLKEFGFVIEYTDKNGSTREVTRHVTSKHLNGAIRKLYQTYDFDRVVRVL